MEQSAYQEAVVRFEQALEALSHLPTHRDRQEQAIDVRLDLRNALAPLGQYERILEHLQAAETLAETLADPHRLGRITSDMSIYFTWASAYDRAIASAQKAISLATSHEDFDVHVKTKVHLGRIYYRVGDHHRALEVLQQTRNMLKGKQIETSYGNINRPSVSFRVFSARCHAELGTFAEGMAIGEEGVRIAESIDDAFNLITAYFFNGQLFFRQGDIDQAITMFERSLTICKAAQIWFEFSEVASALALAYALTGRTAEALSLIEQIEDQVDSRSPLPTRTMVVTELGEASLLVGCLENASGLAKRALAHSRNRKERGVQAWTLRLLGEIAMHRDPPEIDQAKTHYQQALILADELGMRPLQAHCHRGLGTLYSQTGKSEQAHVELSTAIELYREMEMTFWLPQTEATLAEVEGR